MKRKILTIAVIVILALNFTACGGKQSDEAPETPSETFKGVASVQVYASEEVAVKAFLADEFDVIEKTEGRDPYDGSIVTETRTLFSARYVEHIVTGTLSESETADLNLQPDEQTDLVKVKKVSAVFTPYTDNAIDYSELLGGRITQKMFLLEYSDGSYRYYTPLPEVDELLTNSYLESVLEENRYTNCTVDYNFEGSAKLDGKPFETTRENSFLKYTADASYECTERQCMYHDGISREMFVELFMQMVQQGAMSEEDIGHMYEQYLGSKKPWVDESMSMYFEKYILPCDKGFGIVYGGYNEEGVLEFERGVSGWGEAVIDDHNRLTRLELSWYCSAGRFYSVQPFYFRKTPTGFKNSEAFFAGNRPINVTVVNGRLGSVLSTENTDTSAYYCKITFSDFGPTSINPPKKVRDLLS